MPRLTNPAYLQLRRELGDAWDSDRTPFFLLSALDQGALHDYFRFSEKLRDAEMLGHRTVMSASGSSLPQRAGRAAATMIDRIVHHADVLTLKGASYRLRGRGIDSLPSIRTQNPADQRHNHVA